MLVAALLVLGSLALTACEPKTEIVEKVVKETVVQKEVVKETVTEATPEAAEKEGTTPPAAQESTGGTIIRGDFADAEVLNPILFTDNASDIVCQMMYNALVQVNPEDTTVMPDLAERWEVSDDDLTYTYYLRKDVKWHDGEPFTAHDVKFTYEAILNPEVNSPRRADFVDLLSPENIVVVDDYTIRFTLNQIDASWLCCKDIYGILPKHILGDLTPAEFNAAPFNTTEPVGTGPFMFHEWVKDDHVALVKNPDYFDGAPQPDYWYYKVVENETVAFAQLQTGEVDYSTVTAALWDQAQQVEHLDCAAYPRFAFTFYTYNLDPEKTPLFQDVRTRQALLYALDREAMIDSIVFGLADVANSTVPPVSWAHNPDNEPVYPYDPDKAEQLLDDAGWKDEDGDGVREAHGVEGVEDGTKFSFNLENLLRHRRNIEEREKTALSRIQFNLLTEQRKREQIARKNLEALVELESLRRASAGQEELSFYYPYLERLRHEAELSDQSIVRLEKELHEQKSAVLTASRNKKVIEILKSRKKSEFLAEVDRQEQKAVDEMVVSRLGRNRD